MEPGRGLCGGGTDLIFRGSLKARYSIFVKVTTLLLRTFQPLPPPSLPLLILSSIDQRVIKPPLHQATDPPLPHRQSTDLLHKSAVDLRVASER